MPKLLSILRYAAYGAAALALATAAYVGVSLQGLRLDDATRVSVTSVADALIARKLLPSISYAVIEKGNLRPARTFGSTDMASENQADSKTLYEAASLTKPFIAELARRLHSQGVIDLDEPVAQTLSNDRIVDKAAWSRVTARHLLSHTSGLPNWSGDSRDTKRRDQLEFGFAPGSSFRYSGEGYGILLAFLEKKSGRRAEDLANELFKELGMANSTLTARDFVGEYARGHWGTTPSRQAWRTSEPIAAYSLFTNASDYGRLLSHVMKAHAAGRARNDPFTAIQTEVETTESGESIGWSLGWGTLSRAHGTLYFQWGDNGAFRSFAAFDPISRNGIVYFSNGSYGTIFADELSAPVLGNIETAVSWFSDAKIELARVWLRF